MLLKGLRAILTTVTTGDEVAVQSAALHPPPFQCDSMSSIAALLISDSGWDQSKVLLSPTDHVGVQNILSGDTVRLSGMKLRKGDWKLVLDAVRSNSALRSLELASCSIGPGSAVQLVAAIIESRCPVVTLDLSYNTFFKEADAREEEQVRLAAKGKGARAAAALEALAARTKGFDALMRLIREAPALKALRIRRIGLRVQDAVVLAAALREDAGRIEVLDVSDNHKLGSVGAALICAALSRPYSQLTALSLRYCGLACGLIHDTAGPQAELAPDAWKAVRAAGPRALAERASAASAGPDLSLSRRQRMKKATLQKMADGAARVEEARQETLGVGVTALALMLTTNGRLQRLNLSRNELRCVGAKSIASALRTSKIGVTALDLSSNRIAARGLSCLASALQASRCPLRALNLAANPLTATPAAMEGAKSRRPSSKTSQATRESVNYTCDGLLDLAACLRNNHALASLSLAQTGLVPREVERKPFVTQEEWGTALAGVRAIASGLRGNGALLVLDLRKNGRSLAEKSGEARRVVEQILDRGGAQSAVDNAELINAKIVETIDAVQRTQPECLGLNYMTVRWLQADMTQMVFGFLSQRREVLF